MKLLLLALTTIVLSCADYPELDLSIKKGNGVKDGNGKSYATVIIGDQEWMAENLNYMGQTETDTIGLCYNQTAENCKKFGRLYTWIEAMDIEDTSFNSAYFYYTTSVVKYRGICPSGWHIPSSDEWKELLSYVGAANNAIKLKSTSGWKSQATDEYGFLALPGGCHWPTAMFINDCGAWWSSSEKGLVHQVSGLQLCDEDFSITPVPFDKKSWASIRCVKD